MLLRCYFIMTEVRSLKRAIGKTFWEYLRVHNFFMILNFNKILILTDFIKHERQTSRIKNFTTSVNADGYLYELYITYKLIQTETDY